MDICSFVGAGTTLLLQALVPILKKDPIVLIPESNSDVAEPPSKKACRELIQPSTTKRKYSKKWVNKFSWLLYDEDINGAFCRVNRPQQRAPHCTQEVFGSQNCS